MELGVKFLKIILVLLDQFEDFVFHFCGKHQTTENTLIIVICHNYTEMHPNSEETGGGGGTAVESLILNHSSANSTTTAVHGG